MPDNKKAKAITIVVIVLIVIIAAVMAAMKLAKNNAKTTKTESPVFTVKKGPLQISISESGTIKPQDQIVLKSEVEGRSTVLKIIPEATQVKKGDLLVELDATTLKDNLVRQQITVQKAEASFVQAREDLAVGKNQAQSDVEKAELTLEFAKQDLDKYINGEFPNQLKEAESKIILNKEQEERASDKYLSSLKLYEDKYIAELELKTDKLAFDQAKLNTELAESDLELLKNYTYKRQVATLESDVKQAQMALERTRRKAAANVVQYEAQLKSAQSVLQREKDILNKLEDQIAKATIYAPADGLVVYATSTRGSWRGNQEPLDVGAEVYEHQELIYLPAANSVKAELSIHESSLNKVFQGMAATITVDALPGKVFHGKVNKIAILPDAQMIWMNPDLKVYTTDVFIEGDTAELRTGMSCNVEISINFYENALYVPIQAVVRVGNEHWVYVTEGKKSLPRVVEIGLDNNRMMHIKSGLKEGEHVILNPPLSESENSHSRKMPPDMKNQTDGKKPSKDNRQTQKQQAPKEIQKSSGENKPDTKKPAGSTN